MKNSRFTKGTIATALAIVIAGAGMLYGQRQRKRRSEPRNANIASREMPAEWREHTVTSKDGKTITLRVEGNVFTTDVPDGTYKLTKGGAIRVRNGRVVWDAFGAANRLKAGRWKGPYTDPSG